MLHKVLIANRGEIALRVLRACREMNILTVAVHSTADSQAMHVRLADESVCIGPPSVRDSYLNMPAILSAAHITGADAIHPGLGFLAENGDFAQMVEDHGLTFIGPTPEHIRMMGDKVVAKRVATELGLPIIPGSDGAIIDLDVAIARANEIGYPVLLKAAGGGGGRGMKVVRDAGELASLLPIARAEAKAFFSNDEVYFERYLDRPRHIEVQILADGQGACVHLGERDCTVQRSHQKIIEEAPSPVLTPAERTRIGAVATEAMLKLGYRGVGTLEFLYQDGHFAFIEMNTRIQVEHPVSELIASIDLVREQIRIAGGETLGYAQADVHLTGHAIECRINAENPVSFMPSPGKVTAYHAPGGYGIRVDSALYPGYTVPSQYDSLVAKLIAYGRTREECIQRLKRALHEYVIAGIETNIPLHRRLLDEPDFIAGNYDVHWLERLVGRVS
jgi:acetyl-CoA carboxylase biotin carboxylase subunit